MVREYTLLFQFFKKIRWGLFCDQRLFWGAFCVNPRSRCCWVGCSAAAIRSGTFITLLRFLTSLWILSSMFYPLMEGYWSLYLLPLNGLFLFWILSALAHYLVVLLLGIPVVEKLIDYIYIHIKIPFLVFWGTALLFSIVVMLFYIHTCTVRELQFFTSLPILITFWFG